MTDTSFDKECPFCSIIALQAPGQIVFEEELALAILDYRPVAGGRCLVIPRSHFVDVTDIPSNVAAELSAMVRRVVLAQRVTFNVSGALILNNNVVDQHVSHHHIHVVPRRVADGIGVLIKKRPSNSKSSLEETADALRGTPIP